MATAGRPRQIDRLAEGLLKEGALQFSEVTLPDGRESPYFVNLRGLSSYPGTFKAVLEAMTAEARKLSKKVDALCAVPTSGVVLVAPIALSLGKPLLYMDAQRHVNQRSIEGQMKPGWRFLVVDDLVDSGNSLLKAAQTIRQEGGEVEHALVFLDRLEGGRKRLAKEGVSLHAVTNILQLAESLHSLEMLGDSDFRSIRKSVTRD